jgi:hypothetical protein
MRLGFLLLLAGCPKQSEPVEPKPETPPWLIDAGVDTGPSPMQTPIEGITIRASNYAQHCTRDDECVGVFEGDVCNPCRCAFNAIRVEAFPKYRADLGQAWACHKPDDCRQPCRQITGAAAKCEAGTCTLPP